MTSLKTLQYFFALSLLSLCLALSAQVQFSHLELVKVEARDGASTVDVYFKALDADGGIVDSSFLKNKLSLLDSLNGEAFRYSGSEFFDDAQVFNTVHYERIITAKDTFTLDLVVDVGEWLTTDHRNEVVKLLKQVADQFPLTAPSRYRLFTFASTIDPVSELVTEDFANIDNRIQRRNEPTYLYDGLDFIFKEEVNSGKRIIICLTGGQDASPLNLRWRPRTATEVATYITETGLHGQWFFPVVLQNASQDTALQAFVNLTTQTDDVISTGSLPTVLDSLKTERKRLAYTHRIRYVPDRGEFAGEARTWLLSYENELISKPFVQSFGSPNAPRLLRSTTVAEWFLYFFLGLTVLVVSFLGGAFLLPVLRQRNFMNKYVRPYEKQEGRRHLDPFTNLTIEAGEPVVHRCPQMTTWESWKSFGYQCPNYPDCIRTMKHLNCDGEGAPEESQHFFAMSGINRYLNWALFGMIGGFLAWALFALIKGVFFEGYRKVVQNLAERFSVRADFQLDDLTNQTLIGIAFGFGLILLLAIVEERGQSRYISIGRILLRTFLGTILVTSVFVGGFYLHYQLGSASGMLIDGLMWGLLGISIGLVLSINSTVDPIRGIIGGLLAGALAFSVYLLMAYLADDYHLAKLISLLLMGTLLGWVMVSVVAAAEDMEIEYLSPVKYHRTVPISKWLKQGLQVDIGTDQGAYIPVKWPDPQATSRHALLSMDGQQVRLLALAETLINNNQLLRADESRILKHGDIIQLGRDGMSKFRFRSNKQKTISPPSPPRNDSKGSGGITITRK